MKNLLICFIALAFFFFFPLKTLASSTYVLPYPGIMPGNKFYSFFEFIDKIKGNLAVGDFAQFSHNLSQSDKYLVESKVLFEYKQYLLALNSIERSNKSILQAKKALVFAEKNNKPVFEKKRILQEAILKHIEVLKDIVSKTPKKFLWEEKNTKAKLLDLHLKINDAIQLRTTL